MASNQKITYPELVSQAGDWQKAQSKIAPDVETYKKVIASLTTTSAAPTGEQVSYRITNNGSDFLSVAGNYAELTKHSIIRHESQSRFSRFQLLLALSCVLFVKSKGCTAGEADRLIQTMTQCPTEKRRRRILIRIKHLNSVIGSIARKCQWNIARATEVFFVCKSPSLRNGITWNRLTIETDPLTLNQLLKMKDEDLNSIPSRLHKAEHDFSDCMKPYYSIPTLLLRLLDPNGLSGNTLYVPMLLVCLVVSAADSQHTKRDL